MTEEQCAGRAGDAAADVIDGAEAALATSIGVAAAALDPKAPRGLAA